MKARTDRAKRLENYAAKAGEAWDVEDEQLRAEFANLDLTEMEMADLHEAFRLRRAGAARSEQIASKALFAAVRRSLAEALKTTLDYESRNDRMLRALASFDRDEAIGMERLEIALVRPASDEELASLHRTIDKLNLTRDRRRRETIAMIDEANDVTSMPRSDAMRIDDRDHLALLFDRGQLTLRQVLAGYAYRRRWEAAFRGLRSVLATAGGTKSPLRQVAAQERSALWEAQRSRCDTAIVLRLRQHPNALMLLRRIAGEGDSVSRVCGPSGGKTKALALDVLVKALNVVADVLPYEDV